MGTANSKISEQQILYGCNKTFGTRQKNKCFKEGYASIFSKVFMSVSKDSIWTMNCEIHMLVLVEYNGFQKLLVHSVTLFFSYGGDECVYLFPTVDKKRLFSCFCLERRCREILKVSKRQSPVCLWYRHNKNNSNWSWEKGDISAHLLQSIHYIS